MIGRADIKVQRRYKCLGKPQARKSKQGWEGGFVESSNCEGQFWHLLCKDNFDLPEKLVETNI